MLKAAIAQTGIERGHWYDDLELAVGEAVTNSYQHAGGGYIRVVASLIGDTIMVRVADRGLGFDGPPPPFTADSERGRGRQIMAKCCSSVDTCRCGEWFCVLLTCKMALESKS